VEADQGRTIVGKVPCAVLVSLDEETGKVGFTPPAAASNPQVIAILVEPARAGEDPAADDPVGEGDAQEAPAVPKPAARGNQDQAEEPVKKKAAKAAEPRRKSAAKRQRLAKRKDRCGSMKAAWYTNKEGRRSYRCVRQG
jgi:hypothetical protein